MVLRKDHTNFARQMERQNLMSNFGTLSQDQQNKPQGLFDYINGTMQSPLFLAGAGLVSGEGFGGAMQGMRMGMAAQDRTRQQAESDARKAAFEGLLSDPSKLPQGMPMGALNIVRAAGPEAGLPMLAGMIPKPMTPTDDLREYSFAKSQGFAGSFLDFDNQRRAASAARTNINLPMETSYDKEMGKQLAGEFIKSQEVAGKAAQAQGDLRVMQQAAENPAVYTGTGGNAIHGLKKAAQTLFGVDVQGVPEGELIQRTTAKIALSLKDSLPGPMSDSDRQFLMDLPPGLTTSPEGMRRVVNLGLAQRQWEIERAKAAQSYASRNGGRLTPDVYRVLSGIDKKWADRMGAITRDLQKQRQTAPRAPTTGVPVDTYRNKYGLE